MYSAVFPHNGISSEVHHREIVGVPTFCLGHTMDLGELVDVPRGDTEPHLHSPSTVLKVAGLTGRVCFGGRRPWGLKMCGWRSGVLFPGLVLDRLLLSSRTGDAGVLA